MATTRSFKCTSCSAERQAAGLYESLLAAAETRLPCCAVCGGPTVLQLGFPLAFGAGGGHATVLGSFHTSEQWPDAATGGNVSFEPFLVVLLADNGERCAWLPYWHIQTRNGRVKRKYGQWAPYMGLQLYRDLTAQATAAGLLA